jgi:hypothetical protein
MHKYPHEISGGMKQRVGIARAFAMEPKILLMDEPFGALDALTRASLQDELNGVMAKTGATVVMVTHDVDEAVLLSDRIVMMTNGPAATIGEILEVELERPRDRLALAQDRLRRLPRGGVRAHVLRRCLAGNSSPFTSLRGTPHIPDRVTPSLFDRCKTDAYPAKDGGYPDPVSKGGGAGAARDGGHGRSGYPPSLAVQHPQQSMPLSPGATEMNARIEAAPLNEHRNGRRPKLVVVGNGMAGIRAVEELLKLAPDLYDITVFGAEPHPNYNRILLSPVLAGEMTINDIVLNRSAVVSPTMVSACYTGKTVTKIDRNARKVIADDGTEEEYDRLLLATGSNPSSCRFRARSARRDQLPRHQGHRRDDRRSRDAQARGGDRRRPAGAGSRQRPQAARHGRHRGACDALADGAPARQDRGRHAEDLAGSARPQVPAGRSRPNCADPRPSPAGSAPCASRTASKWPPIWW